MRSKVRQLSDEEIRAQIAADPDDWESTDEELAQAVPFVEAFPELAESIRRSRGRPKLNDAKAAVTLRVKPGTIERFKATGKDWRAKMSSALDKAKL